MRDVLVAEVGPRDGLQNEAVVLSPATRAELVNRLTETFLPRIECVSFVRDERVPQMTGAEEVVAALHRAPSTSYAGLVLNRVGLERLWTTALDRANVTFAATDAFNRQNGNRSLADAVCFVEQVVDRIGSRAITVTISAAFGCPFEGNVDPGVVADLAARFVDRADVVLADTIGAASPRTIRAVYRRTAATGFHGHNTRNAGYANCLAALEEGATVLDASIGGLGGCPFSPGATGNVATEDLVYLLEAEGIATGIDLDALLRVVDWLEVALGKEVEGRISHAGRWPAAVR